MTLLGTMTLLYTMTVQEFHLRATFKDNLLNSYPNTIF